MRLERLPIFIDLYETRSYTKAAQKNYVSQTSVTQLVNSLEEEFGVKLLDRSTLPIQATAAGNSCIMTPNCCCGNISGLKRCCPGWSGKAPVTFACATPPRLT